MTVRDTSAVTYRIIKENGLLSAVRQRVYDVIYVYGPCTATEVFTRLGCKTNQSGRITELCKLGVVQDVGTTVCRSTGQTVTLWDVTSSLPAKTKRTESRIKRLERALDVAENALGSWPIKIYTEAVTALGEIKRLRGTA